MNQIVDLPFLGRVHQHVDVRLLHSIPILIKDSSIVREHVSTDSLDVVHDIVASILAVGSIFSLIIFAFLLECGDLIEIGLVQKTQCLRNNMHVRSLTHRRRIWINDQGALDWDLQLRIVLHLLVPGQNITGEERQVLAGVALTGEVHAIVVELWVFLKEFYEELCEF